MAKVGKLFKFADEWTFKKSKSLSCLKNFWTMVIQSSTFSEAVTDSHLNNMRTDIFQKKGYYLRKKIFINYKFHNNKILL